ncbi:MAG: hypothetical protein J6J36_05680 [Clostridia bacterium]|nr:hypothetical protein [Clostridia bacterium]
MASNFYAGEMLTNEKTVTNKLNSFLDEQEQDSSYINTWGLGAANVTIPAKDTIVIKGKDANGNETEKIYTTGEVLNTIINDISSRIRKYSVARDGYYRFCRADELKNESINIPPMEVHRVFYDMVVDAYEKKSNNQMKFLRDELTANGLTIIPEMLTEPEEVRQEKIKELYEFVLRSDIAMVLYEIEAARRIYSSRVGLSYRKQFIKCLNDLEHSLEEEIIKYVDENDIDLHLYTQIAAFSQLGSGINEFIIASYNAQEGVTDQDVLAMFDNLLGKERIANYIKNQPESIVERKQLVKNLTKKRIYIRGAT